VTKEGTASSRSTNLGCDSLLSLKIYNQFSKGEKKKRKYFIHSLNCLPAFSKDPRRNYRCIGILPERGNHRGVMDGKKGSKSREARCGSLKKKGKPKANIRRDYLVGNAKDE